MDDNNKYLDTNLYMTSEAFFKVISEFYDVICVEGMQGRQIHNHTLFSPCKQSHCWHLLHLVLWVGCRTHITLLGLRLIHHEFFRPNSKDSVSSN